MTKELAEARAEARAAQDRANRAEAALREILGALHLASLIGSKEADAFRSMFRKEIKRHGVNLGGDQ